MNTDKERENAAGDLNSKLHPGPKAEVELVRERKSIPWKISLGGIFQAKTQFEAP